MPFSCQNVIILNASRWKNQISALGEIKFRIKAAIVNELLFNFGDGNLKNKILLG